MTNNPNTLDKVTFNRLRKLYIIALGAIAISLVTSQILIRQYLADQEDDSRLINVAGRQRMLSQKLSKEALLLSLDQPEMGRRALEDTLLATKSDWQAAHNALLNGDEKLGLDQGSSPEISRMFEEIHPLFESMVVNTDSLIRHSRQSIRDSAAFQRSLHHILESSKAFLARMERIVNQYDFEAKQKVESLKQLELIITVFTLLILLAEFLIIFCLRLKPCAPASRS
ncbi:type IV pili methyl-accepting chemotaxis transducer N-terminal domain-containing protein [Algoriphagus boritolerans]|uniref:type IV pili methyl-accepting chemotaxis transducer N-terminal domain-containing protein n=1 Tax=Algoriphagus boritolerans TaxID=308111 RepID=UPI000A9B250D